MSNGTTKKQGATAKGKGGSGSDDSGKDEGTTYEKSGTAEGRPTLYEKVEVKGDKRYTRGTKGPQRVAEGFNRAMERIAVGMADGVKEYRERSEESARDKKDGMLHDFAINASEGFSKAMAEASKAPREIAEELTPKRIVRMATPPFMRSDDDEDDED